MKKIISLALVAVMLLVSLFTFASCGDDNKIIVQTNAFFAPFEYYDGDKIVGVDVEIMNLVGEKLGKEVEFKDGDFAVIIDVVKEGKTADCGAAGLTITDERKEKVDFSIPYYTSVQYVIFKKDNAPEMKTAEDGSKYVVWEALAGKKIGTQTDTTGWIYTDGEVNATADNDYGYDGVLYGTGATCEAMDSAQIAVDGLGNLTDVVVIDELPAKYIVSKNSGLECVPLYYSGADGEADSIVEEQYAICVTKGNTELLNAINSVLEDLIKEDKINEMVMRHMGMDQ
ncbi:MAG: transporter substrate-binding domain-containing protein [Ruminococcaceae bacterium]|nr:transporter substrate-binding domain-containing protein [Oscillospiraceae bacterium]